MRGKALYDLEQDSAARITPAHAGKRGSGLVKMCLIGDHPRACGEKFTKCAASTGCKGSPPRMRGKVSFFLSQYFTVGITPAHAGKSMGTACTMRLNKDHPRACGEKDSVILLFLPVGGSPPRMRGKAFVLCGHGGFVGITPAHAGKSGQHPGHPQPEQDHPRACGEKTKKIPYHRLFPLRSTPFSFSFA